MRRPYQRRPSRGYTQPITPGRGSACFPRLLDSERGDILLQTVEGIIEGCDSWSKTSINLGGGRLCDWHWRHTSIRPTPACLLVPHCHDVLTASTHTSYRQQPSDRTKDVTSRPDPNVDSWSTTRQRPTRPGRRLSSHWTITASILVECRRSLSRKAIRRQLCRPIVNCTQLMTLLPNGWRHTASKCTSEQQQQLSSIRVYV